MPEPGQTALLFPGAGIDLLGCELELVHRHPDEMRPLLEAAGRRAGRDLAAALEPAAFAALGSREQQLLTYAYSVGMSRVLAAEGITPAFAAGHSLGIYAALAVVGSVNFEDGLAMIDAALAAVRRAAAGGAHGMVALAGFGEADVDALLAGGGFGDCRRAVANGPACAVVSGGRGPLEAFAAAAQAAGALRVAWLDREVPYHHPSLAPASDEFARFLAGLRWRDADRPVISTLDQRALVRADDLRDLTARNLSSPIDWAAVIATLAGRGVEVAWECGPGQTLTRLGRFLDVDVAWRNVRSLTRRGG